MQQCTDMKKIDSNQEDFLGNYSLNTQISQISSRYSDFHRLKRQEVKKICQVMWHVLM